MRFDFGHPKVRFSIQGPKVLHIYKFWLLLEVMQTPAQFAGRGAMSDMFEGKSGTATLHCCFQWKYSDFNKQVLLSMMILMASPAIDVLGQPWQFPFFYCLQ